MSYVNSIISGLKYYTVSGCNLFIIADAVTTLPGTFNLDFEL